MKKNLTKVAVYSKDGKWLSNTNPAKARKLLTKGVAIVFRYKPFAIKINKKGECMFVSYKNSIVNLDKVEAVEIKDDKIMFFTDNMVNKTNWRFDKQEDAIKAYSELKSILSAKLFD